MTKASLQEKTLIRARSPLRLGLAGGGTDVSPYCDEYGGRVVNITIDMYVHTLLELASTPVVHFSAVDRCCQQTFKLEYPLPIDIGMPIHACVYNVMMSRFNEGQPIPIHMTTYSEAPFSSGLGASSALVVSMVQAYNELLQLGLCKAELAELAIDIERHHLNLLGGKQDQYASAFGGLNCFEFKKNGDTSVHPLSFSEHHQSALESSLILYYTRKARHANKIMSEQRLNISKHLKSALDALDHLKQSAQAIQPLLENADIAAMGALLDETWQYKKQLAHDITTPEINQIYNTAKQVGAYGGKVSGAGGGGFMMFLVDPTKRASVTEKLNALGGVVKPCHFTKDATDSWRVF
ncbi:MAG: dehydrogenase [Gammaproteobacteria bacterium]